MKQSSKRFTSMLLAVALVLGAFITFFNFVQPAYGEVSKLRGLLESKTRFAVDQAKAIAQIKKLVADAAVSVDTTKAISFAFPESPDTPLAVGQVNGLLTTNSFALQSISVVEESALLPTVLAEEEDGTSTGAAFVVAPIRKVQLRTSAKGTYENLKRFLENVETNVRIMDVTDLTLQRAGRPEENVYTAGFTIVAYYQDPI